MATEIDETKGKGIAESENKRNLTHYKLKIRSSHPSMSSEFACDVACANIPQDHCLIRAAGTNVAAVIGAVKTNKVYYCVG